MNLIERLEDIEELFDSMDDGRTGLDKQRMVNNFKLTHSVQHAVDLDFAFEVLAGKHKLGYTFDGSYCNGDHWMREYGATSFENFYNTHLKIKSLSRFDIECACVKVPSYLADFFEKLCNREYRLGYSNKQFMKTDYTPMLAHKYPDDWHGKEDFYFIQEKLDGNRCIAYFGEDGKWHFMSRSGKEKDLPIDMSGMDPDRIFDGEVMTFGKAGTRDFNATSGAINGKYTDKSALHYYVYDILVANIDAKIRRKVLESQHPTGNVTILKTIEMKLYPNPEYNTQLDEYLDKIVAAGGEGVIIRDENAFYEQKRSYGLLKYKGVQTMDMEVIGIEPGTGKYTGMVGSLICRCCGSNNRTFECNVGSGLTDYQRLNWRDSSIIGKIVEVAYFSISQNKSNKDTNRLSLRFPRLLRVRDDKTETSEY